MLTETVVWPEALIIAFTTVAIFVKFLSVRECWLDLSAAKVQDRRAATTILARGNLRTAWLHLGVKFTILLYWMIAAATPPINPDNPVPALTVVLMAFHVAMVSLLFAATLFDRIDRQILMDRSVAPDDETLTLRLINERLDKLESLVEQLVQQHAHANAPD